MLAVGPRPPPSAQSSAPPRTGTFAVHPDPGCQRGLHLLYCVPAATDLRRLQASLEQTYPAQLLVADESWGRRQVRRIVMQFRFEVRLGVRDEQISFFFRATSPPEDNAS